MDTAEARVRQPSVVRAWLVAHDARSVVAAMAVLVVVLCLGAQWLLPVPGQPLKVPFWQLTPAMLAMVASLGTVNLLPSGRSGPQRIARATWAGCVIATAAGCSWIVGQGTTHLPSLVPGTSVVVALTFTASVVVGRMSVWVGALLVGVILVRVTTMQATEDLWSSLPGATRLALAAVATIGLAAYTWVGTPGSGIRDAVTTWLSRWQPREKG